MKKIILTIFILLAFSFSNKVFAQFVSIESNNSNPKIGEEFYVDINLDTEGVGINGIESEFIFDNKIFQITRLDNSKSIFSYWINQSINPSGLVSFAGVSPNGFTGYLNNIESSTKANVLRLYLKPISSGQGSFAIRNINLTNNDGEGSIIRPNNTSIVVNVSNEVNYTSIEINDVIKPSLEATIVTDELLYDGKKTLVFNAIDKESGIKSVYIKTKSGWVPITSPYLLDSSVYAGILSIKAIDFAGNETTKKFILGGDSSLFYILVILIFIILFIYIKNVFKNKNKIK